MPSPFPGMDPWLESPQFWPDIHDALAGEVRAALNQALPKPYYAQLGVREEVGITARSTYRTIVRDVSVQRSREPDSGGTQVAVEAGPRTEISEYVEMEVRHEPIEVNFVEVRDIQADHEVVTLIEILSPSNKRPGENQNRYIQKRNEVLGSTASLIEIDLLRDGDRSLYGEKVRTRLRQFDILPHYVALVQRSWKRADFHRYQMFPFSVRDTLPVIAVPLRESESAVPLDLQYAFQQTYDRGPYRRGVVDYSAPPEPPLAEDLQAWAAERVKALVG